MNNFHVGMSGEFRSKLWNSDGSLAHDTGWGRNLILDSGLLLCAANGWGSYCLIGNSSTAPNIAQTSLQGFLASQGSIQSNSGTNNTSSPYEVTATRTWRFAAGVATGTIAEMGVGAVSTNTNLFCRHLVSPPFVKGATQILDVSYRITMFPPLTQAINNGVVIGGVTYDTITTGLQIGQAGVAGTGAIFGPLRASTVASDWNLYDGNLGAITASNPLGSPGLAAGNNISVNTGNGSGFSDFKAPWTLNIGNAPLKCRTAMGGVSTGWRFQTQFTATDGPDIGGPLPKDGTNEFTGWWRYSWGRTP